MEFSLLGSPASLMHCVFFGILYMIYSMKQNYFALGTSAIYSYIDYVYICVPIVNFVPTRFVESISPDDAPVLGRNVLIEM